MSASVAILTAVHRGRRGANRLKMRRSVVQVGLCTHDIASKRTHDTHSKKNLLYSKHPMPRGGSGCVNSQVVCTDFGRGWWGGVGISWA